MRCAQAILIASAVGLLLVGRARAQDYPVTTSPLYTATGIATRIDNPKVRAELKLTPEQDKALKGRRLWTMCDDVHAPELDKITGPDRAARVRALFTQRADAAFAAVGQVLRPEQIARLKQIALQSK